MIYLGYLKATFMTTALEAHSAMMTPTIATLRAHLLNQCPDLDAQAWWLLGTSNCHLCQSAESLIRRLQAVTPVIYQTLDIMRLQEADTLKFASQIPIILTPTAQLAYPFSVLDLQQLHSITFK